MRNTLEDLYYGNITPGKQQIVPDSELKRATDRVARFESQLTERLDEDGQTILAKNTCSSGAITNACPQSTHSVSIAVYCSLFCIFQYPPLQSAFNLVMSCEAIHREFDNGQMLPGMKSICLAAVSAILRTGHLCDIPDTPPCNHPNANHTACLLLN